MAQGGKPSTMREIAALAGVSVTTVSHVLSGRRPVNQETAQRVLAVIEQHRYVPASAARRLQSGRSRLIALVIPEIAASYFGQIARGVEHRASESGYGLLVCGASYLDPGLGRRYLDLLRDGTVDGAIYTVTNPLGEHAVLSVVASEHPLVLVDERVPGVETVPSVTADNVQGGRLIAAHVAELGHRRVVVVAGPADLASTQDRIAGIKERFPTALVLHGEYSRESGYALTRDLIANDVPVTCLLCGNDEIALGAARALAEAGLRVPADVSLAGFDDVEVAALISPPLTTVHQPAELMGRRAADLLIAKLDDAQSDGGDAAVSQIVLAVELVVRGTTARPSA